MSQQDSQVPIPGSDTSQDDGKLHIKTDVNPNIANSKTPSVDSTNLLSPISRKRAEENDDCADTLGHLLCQNGETISNNDQSSLPPLKKSKTSIPLSQASLTEYRSSQDVIDDHPSPQTSPMLEPTPHNIDRATAAEIRELKNITLSQLSQISDDETSFENLSLGTRNARASGRAPGLERAMGVITNSRQGSPALSTSFTITCDTDIMLAEKVTVHSSQDIQDIVNIDDPIDLTNSDIMDTTTEDILDVANLESDEYNDDEDDDYEAAADTTVDENYNRVETSESEDDDSFSDINVDNITSSNYSGESSCEAPYVDMDPYCLDRLTQEEEDRIIAEAREFGVGHIIQEYIMTDAYSVKKLLLMTYPDEVKIPTHFTENDLISVFAQRLQREITHRRRLPHINSLNHVIDLLQKSKNIMILTGAGVSVSCGIPDFRSPDGIYSRLSEFDLEDPTQMFELEFFCEKPEVFYSFAREIFPSNFIPSPSHYFIKLIEEKGKLLRNYTQNIDTLEQQAGIRNVLQCHGSFATASCVRCKRQVPGDDIKESIFKQEVAYCKVCGDSELPQKSELSGTQELATEDELEPAVMKPDIVFFGERLPWSFDGNFDSDKDKVDLLIVIGSSLKVAPVSDIMYKLPRDVPQILINRTPITHTEFDVQLLGNCDTIVAELCRLAGWELKHEKLPGGTSNIPDMEVDTNADGSGKGGHAHWSLIEPNTYLFEGAILGDVEYESSQTISKKRGRFDRNDIEGYEADTDDEGFSLRRRDLGRIPGAISSKLMSIDNDVDNHGDSDESQGTIRDIQPESKFDSSTLESSFERIPFSQIDDVEISRELRLDISQELHSLETPDRLQDYQEEEQSNDNKSNQDTQDDPDTESIVAGQQPRS
ncbi:NAD-dependent histone deacetylase sir2 [Entomortierella beljakovae]|nr:NAD-dependent histone deacetylase sir2 [Entomortierella beljakovae]